MFAILTFRFRVTAIFDYLNSSKGLLCIFVVRIGSSKLRTMPNQGTWMVQVSKSVPFCFHSYTKAIDRHGGDSILKVDISKRDTLLELDALFTKMEILQQARYGVYIPTSIFLIEQPGFSYLYRC